MVLGAAELFCEPLHRKYYASRLSCAYLFFLGCVAVLLLVPFFMAYSAGEFWLKSSTYREQASVKYEYKIIHLLEGTTTDGEPFQLFFSTINTVNQYLQASLRVPLIQSREVDQNRDGLVDRVEINIQTPIQADERIYGATMIAFFDYQIRDRAKIRMESIAYISHSSGLAGRSLLVDGDLSLRQSWPLQVVGGYKTLYGSDPLVDTSTIAASQLKMDTIIQKYRARNFTADFVSPYNVWGRAGPAPGDAEVSFPIFNLTATIRIPISDVLYTPDVAEVLKEAWIQYLAMLVVVGYLLDRLCSFVYYHQVVETRSRLDWQASVALKQQKHI